MTTYPSWYEKKIKDLLSRKEVIEQRIIFYEEELRIANLKQEEYKAKRGKRNA